MSCEHLYDAIVDVARGRDVGLGTVGTVEAHIEHCASCRSRFAREQNLSDGLRALAKSIGSSGASASVEVRLLAAFADQRTANGEPRTATRPPSRATGFGWHPSRRFGPAEALAKAGGSWMRTAAALALLGAGAVAWWLVPRGTRIEGPPNVHESKTPPSTEAHAPSVATALPLAAHEPRRRPASPVRRPASARIIRPEGFVALPSATGLPAFESGEIVRVEVPITSLPMYGIDIAPDARGPAVEADFLVGQDGQARAIRLVRNGRL